MSGNHKNSAKLQETVQKQYNITIKKKANKPEQSKTDNTINYDTIFVINVYEVQEVINFNCQKKHRNPKITSGAVATLKAINNSPCSS